MSKTAGYHDMIHLHVNGKWSWNENNHCLEYHHSGDKSDGKKGRDKNARRLHHEQYKKLDRGATPSVGGRGFGQGRQSRMPGQRSPTRQNKNQSGERTHVTLNDVKSLAMDMLSEVEPVSDTFEGLYNSDQFDEFLLFLLNYFHCFFEKRTHEQKPNPMNIEPSLREIRYYDDLCTSVEAAQKLLGKYYCVLVLGIGLHGQHHMACGSSRVSSTYKDRSMYETFYSFCTFIVWISFRRREFEIVKAEIGRMLRSETFNPAIRIKNAPAEKHEEEKTEENAENEDEKKMTPAEYRRSQGRRPPIKSIINQRSPALVSILPSPKEEANWLFKRTGALSPNSLATTGGEDLDEEMLQGQFAHLNIDISKLKVGIVGEPLNQFNPVTLTPLDADNEEGNNEENEDPTSTRRESHIPPSTGKSAAGDASRQQTGISQVTTDALPDDD